MSDAFKERENAFEAKYAQDQEKLFKIMARRNKLLGLWAAELLGKSGDAANEYALEVIRSDFEEAGDEDVFRKIRGDFDNSDVDVADDALRAKMIELLGAAENQINEAD